LGGRIRTPPKEIEESIPGIDGLTAASQTINLEKLTTHLDGDAGLLLKMASMFHPVTTSGLSTRRAYPTVTFGAAEPPIAFFS
jgi:hypothetical protein